MSIAEESGGSTMMPALLLWSEHQVELSTALPLGLQTALIDFAQSQQDLGNFSLVMGGPSDAEEALLAEEASVSVTFLAKLEPGKNGLGNANRLGKSITYVISKRTGAILRHRLSK